jgi:hypothetical protein
MYQYSQLSIIRGNVWSWIGHTLRKDDSEPCKAALQWIHTVQEEGVGREIHGDQLHWMKLGSTAGVISDLSPGTEKDGEDL